MLTNSKIALSVALVLATASAAVAYDYEDTSECFDGESCRRSDAVSQCVREHIRHDDKAASQRPPIVGNALSRSLRARLYPRLALAIYCRRMLRN